LSEMHDDYLQALRPAGSQEIKPAWFNGAARAAKADA
jgi:hypothetical protein